MLGGGSAAASSAATPNAAAPAASWVPDRARCWLPPCSSGSTVADRATSRAPMPTGPPILCAETLSAGGARARGSRSAPSRRRRSRRGARARRSAPRPRRSSATGWSVPTSLFAQSAVTSATSSPPVASAASSASSRMRPELVDLDPVEDRALVRGEPLDAVDGGVVLGHRDDDAGAVGGLFRAQNRPLMPRLTASVPLPVKTTSTDPRPASARSARGRSRAARAPPGPLRGSTTGCRRRRAPSV